MSNPETLAEMLKNLTKEVPKIIAETSRLQSCISDISSLTAELKLIHEQSTLISEQLSTLSDNQRHCCEELRREIASVKLQQGTQPQMRTYWKQLTPRQAPPGIHDPNATPWQKKDHRRPDNKKSPSKPSSSKQITYP